MKPETIFALIMMPILFSTFAFPAYGAVGGPYDLWWNIGILGSERFPGGTVYFYFEFVNSSPYLISIDSATLITPWRTFSDFSLPLWIYPGEVYDNTFEMTIPSGQAIGYIQFTFMQSAREWTGFAWSSFSPVTYPFDVLVIPDPYDLQSQVAQLEQKVSSLQGQVSSLQSSVNSLNDQIAGLKTKVTSLQGERDTLSSQVTTLQSQIDSLQAERDKLSGDLVTASRQLTDTQVVLESKLKELTDTQAKLKSTETRLSGTQGTLDSTQQQLTDTRVKLAKTEDQLGTFSAIYLPVGTAVPAVIAALLAVLLVRRKK